MILMGSNDNESQFSAGTSALLQVSLPKWTEAPSRQRERHEQGTR